MEDLGPLELNSGNHRCWCWSFGHGVQGCAAVDKSHEKRAFGFRERGGSVALPVRRAGQHAKLAIGWEMGLSHHSPSSKDHVERFRGVVGPFF